MRRPTRLTVGGRTYLDLQNLARRTRQPTDELLTRFVLERFLHRLARSPHRNRLILKGGMLLEVFDVRRPTRDIDLLGQSIDNDPAQIGSLIGEIAAVQTDDGVLFRPERLTAGAIRDDDVYGGVRVRMPAELDRARTTLSLDVSVGDPVAPAPVTIAYPSLLGGEAFEIIAYPLATILAEKIETMIRRGAANTRERDFADVWLLLSRHEITTAELRTALHATARHRGTTLIPLLDAVEQLASVRQGSWATFRNRARIDAVPEDLAVVLDDIARFVDPVIAHDEMSATWRPATRTWDA